MKLPVVLAIGLFAFAKASLQAPWMNLQDAPKQRAAALLANLTLPEKLHFFHGSGDGYVGNVQAQRNGAIPALKLNDGPQGFRDNAHPGTSTSWPSALAIASTWNRDSAGQWGKGMGQEFFGKGSNVQLGPGMCVARVPHNGRNFEYLSGEDPALGTGLVPAVVQGIQGEGVIANAKHWVNNNQETDRTSVSENVDERTRFELYYPPFQAASDAGVGSMMCSYNKIHGKWSCENPETLQRDLKDRLGFEGWVMSDWGATHSTSINEGLDQEMPRSKSMNEDKLGAMLKAGTLNQSKVDDSVMRILTPMFAMGLFDSKWRDNKGSLSTNVTSEEHNTLARQLAGEGIVMLKNQGTLPLGTGVKNIAVFGAQAVSPAVHGGGSGRVTSYYTSAPLDAIRERLGFPSSGSIPSSCSDGKWDVGFDYENTDDQTHANADNVDACCKLCSTRSSPPCNYFSFVGGKCWMKSTNKNRVASAKVTSGSCKMKQPDCHGGICVRYNDGTDLGSAAKLAASADVALVFVSTDSSEGSDRKNLNFDGNDDALVSAVAAANKKTVAIGVAPGAVLTPWRQNVSAALVAFMPGQEYGHAVVDVLFGDVNPSGKLALTLPNKDNECPAFTQDEWPGVGNPKQANYTEELLIGYRCFDAHNIQPAYPFGHGLSYNTFALNDMKVDGMTVSLTVTAGQGPPGAEVVQMYLGFPASVGEPPKILKAFKKVNLKGGESHPVSFELTERDLSIWDTTKHDWSVAKGEFTVMVGTSSRDPNMLTTKYESK